MYKYLRLSSAVYSEGANRYVNTFHLRVHMKYICR